MRFRPFNILENVHFGPDDDAQPTARNIRRLFVYFIPAIHGSVGSLIVYLFYMLFFSRRLFSEYACLTSPVNMERIVPITLESPASEERIMFLFSLSRARDRLLFYKHKKEKSVEQTKRFPNDKSNNKKGRIYRYFCVSARETIHKVSQPTLDSPQRNGVGTKYCFSSAPSRFFFTFCVSNAE